jgi:tetratricopeptide (TPR) repeat protein
MDGHIALMSKQYERAASIFSTIDPNNLIPDLQATYYAELGEAYLFLNKMAESREVLEKGLNIYNTQYTLPILGQERVNNMLGITYYNEGKYATALEYFLKCLDSIVKGLVDDRHFKIKIYRNLGNCYLALKAIDNALDSYHLALRYTVDEEDEEARAALYWGIADINYMHIKNYKEGVSYYYRSAALYRRARNFSLATSVNSSLSSVLLERDQVEEALEVLKTALPEAWKTGDMQPVIYINAQLCRAYTKRGDFEIALQYGQIAVEMAKEQKTPLIKGQALFAVARLKIQSGEIEEGLALYEEIGTYLRQTDHKEILKVYLKDYSDALRRAGQDQKAFEMLIEACKI